MPLSITAELHVIIPSAGSIVFIAHMQLLASLAKHWLESTAGTARQQGGQHLGKAHAAQRRGFNFLRQEVPSDPHGQVCMLLKASYHMASSDHPKLTASTLCCRRSTCGTSMPGAMQRG